MNGERHHCSFCCKSQDEVAKLISGPDSFICDECIVVCVSVLASGERTRAAVDAEIAAAVQTAEAMARAKCLQDVLIYLAWIGPLGRLRRIFSLPRDIAVRIEGSK